jgi:hypothetical protein
MCIVQLLVDTNHMIDLLFPDTVGVDSSSYHHDVYIQAQAPCTVVLLTSGNLYTWTGSGELVCTGPRRSLPALLRISKN